MDRLVNYSESDIILHIISHTNLKNYNFEFIEIIEIDKNSNGILVENRDLMISYMNNNDKKINLFFMKIRKELFLWYGDKEKKDFILSDDEITLDSLEDYKIYKNTMEMVKILNDC